VQQANITSFKVGMKPHNLGKKYINNGEIEFFAASDQIDEYLKNGFILGRLPGSYKRTGKYKKEKLNEESM
jgi:hypothetical protein